MQIRSDGRIRDPEGYRLEVNKQGIQLAASSENGAFYGLMTLLELKEQYPDGIPGCIISDKPDFERRGIYFDCSRGKVPTMDTLKSLVVQLARWKINELQLYVENVFAFKKYPSVHRGFSPLTAEDLLVLQDWCRQHAVELVPSLASFGHMERFLSLPSMAPMGELQGFGGYPGGTTLCPGDPASIRFMGDLYEEFLPLFTTPRFNACCDETWELGEGRSRARAKRLGMERVYLDYILKLKRLADRHGKQLHIWSDIVLNYPKSITQVPRDIVMLNWDYFPEGLRMRRCGELADAGLAFLGCSGTHGWGSHGSRLKTAMGNVQRFAETARATGAEGMLQTDWGDFGHRNTLGVSLCSMAYAAAHFWHGKAVNNEHHTARFTRHQFGPVDACEWSRVIHTLGDIEESIGDMRLYYSLTQSISGKQNMYAGIPPRYPLYRPPVHRKDWIGEAAPSAVEKAVECLSGLKLPSSRKGADKWQRALADDYRLAVHMSLIAARRIQLAQDIRGGQASVTAKKVLGRELETLEARFKTNWLKRNRPSRLADNLRLFRNVRSDLERSG